MSRGVSATANRLRVPFWIRDSLNDTTGRATGASVILRGKRRPGFCLPEMLYIGDEFQCLQRIGRIG